MRDSFWENKRVLITGYEGFLGSWLTKTLLEHKVRLVGLDILTHRKRTILSKEDLSRIKVIQGSVENLSLLENIISENKIEFIFHLAAKSLVNDCLNNPIRAFSSNIKGTWNILDACRNLKFVKALIIASSDKAYGEQKNLPYRETFSLSGDHPYDVSKSCADLIANTYFHTYNLPVSVTRCGNIFGPGDFNFSRIVPDTIRSAIKGEKLILRSDGRFLRDYIFVKDIVNGYLMLGEAMAESKSIGESFNFSYGKPLSVLEIVTQIYSLIGRKPNYKILDSAKYEIRNQYLSSSKAARILDWGRRYTLRNALKETIEWYRKFLEKKERR